MPRGRDCAGITECGGAAPPRAAWGSPCHDEGSVVLKSFIRNLLYERAGIELIRVPKDRKHLIKLRTDPRYLDILEDPAFQRSIDEVRAYTLLDTARLANLWELCRLSNPAGSILEAGVYRGGGSLHLHNAAPDRKIFLCDTFEGFVDVALDDRLDARFRPSDPAVTPWGHTSVEDVRWLLNRKTDNFQLIQGVFPASDVNHDVDGVSFVHLDFDVYSSMAATLDYLSSRLIERSIIVVDDYFRKAEGVVKAVREYTASSRDWMVLPVYPGQGVMLHRSWFDA
jgi:O-methyltransferase